MTDEHDGPPMPSLLQQRPEVPDDIDVDASVLAEDPDEARRQRDVAEDEDFERLR